MSFILAAPVVGLCDDTISSYSSENITSSKCRYIDRVTVDYSYYFGLDLSMPQGNAALGLEILSNGYSLPCQPCLTGL
jgi:hypothetical protein